MAWLTGPMNYRTEDGLVLAGTPFELKDQKEVKRLVDDRGFEKIAAKVAKAILAGEPIEEDETTED